MTIVCRGSQPWQAVFFARILRTPLITPVYLKSPADADRVKGAFDLMLKQIAETRTNRDDVAAAAENGSGGSAPSPSASRSRRRGRTRP
jgi:hypothetical protein